MRDFISEYGFAVLSAIVIIILISMASPIYKIVNNRVKGNIGQYNKVLDSRGYGTFAKIKQDNEGVDDKFYITIENANSEVWSVECRIDKKDDGWTSWTTVNVTWSEDKKTGTFSTNLESGEKIQVRLKDLAQEESAFVYSDIITYTNH